MSCISQRYHDACNVNHDLVYTLYVFNPKETFFSYIEDQNGPFRPINILKAIAQGKT